MHACPDAGSTNQSAGLHPAQDPAATVIISVSPQSRASLAARHGLTPAHAQRKLAALFRGLGAAHVLDLGLARDMALLEAAAEFVARYRERADAAQRPEAGAPHCDTSVHMSRLMTLPLCTASPLHNSSSPVNVL